MQVHQAVDERRSIQSSSRGDGRRPAAPGRRPAGRCPCLSHGGHQPRNPQHGPDEQQCVQARRTTTCARGSDRSGANCRRTSSGLELPQAVKQRWPAGNRPGPRRRPTSVAGTWISGARATRCSAGCVTTGDSPAGRGPVVRCPPAGPAPAAAPGRSCVHGTFQPATTAKHGQDHQRHDHRPRRLVGVVIDVLVAGLAGEGQVPEAEHVEGGDRRPAARRPRRTQPCSGLACQNDRAWARCSPSSSSRSGR